MADGVNIDWSLARPQQDYATTYANAFRLGRQVAGQQTAAGQAQAAQRAELLANLGTGLRAYPYAQRGSILAHMAPALIARGVPAAAIAAFDPSDQALDAAVGAARQMQARLA